MNMRKNLLLGTLKYLLICGWITLFGFQTLAQNVSGHANADNNWSEHVPQYEVQFQTIPATCFNNAKILYAVVDKEHPDTPLDTTTLRENGLEQVRIYRSQPPLDTTRRHSSYYKGGWDTLTLDYGTYLVGVEGILEEYVEGMLTYQYVDTNTVLTVGTNYAMPQAAAMSVLSFKPNSLGNLPTLECKPSGRVQMKIEYGAFPYVVTISPHGNPDSIYRVDTFYTYQYDGTDSMRYDYKYYYTIDSLPGGDWDFYLVDGCHSGLPRVGAMVDIVEVPTPKGVGVFASSGDPYDSNVVKIKVELDNNYNSYLDSLAEYMYYRIYVAEGENTQTPPWQPYPAPIQVTTVFYDTLEGMNYCDIIDQDLVFEYKFEMPECDTVMAKDTFYYRLPNHDYFDKLSDYMVDSVQTLDSCNRTWYSHREYHSVQYHSYEPNYSTNSTNDDNIYRRYHFTFPVYWYYIDVESGDTIKIDTLLSESQSIAAPSQITYAEADTFYHSENLSFSKNIKRVLVDSKGCQLYETIDLLRFDVRVKEEEPSWGISTSGSDHCCNIPRTITLSEINSSEFDLDTVYVELLQSPQNNFYNFTAGYSGSSQHWDFQPYNFDSPIELSGDYNGRRFALSAYCLSSGPYRFYIKTNCGEYYVNKDIAFPDIYSTEQLEEPAFELFTECSDQYIKCMQGQVVRRAFNHDPHTGDEYEHIDSLITYYEIVEGPPGSYDPDANVRYKLNDTTSIRISMPGRYVLRVYPDAQGQELCEDYEKFDTIYYDGNAVTFDYALVLLCDENSHYGNAFVRGKGGTSPYYYALYSQKDLGGVMLKSDTLPSDTVFVIHDSVFENAGVMLSPQSELSCLVKDACGSFFQINFYPQVLSDLQKTWFDNGLKVDTTCEGATIQIHTLQASGAFEYRWTGPNGFDTTISDPYIFIPRGGESGYYKVHIIGTGCDGEISDSIYLGVRPSPHVTVQPMGTVCPGEEVELSFVPTSGDTTAAGIPVTFTVAVENRFGVQTWTFNSIPSGDTAHLTFTPTIESKIYPISMVDELDDGCDYNHADPGDTVTLGMRTDAITPCNIITTHDTVCYLGTGHLTATLQLEGHPVSSDFPTNVRWYADYEMTHLLTDTIIEDGYSYYDTAGLTHRTILYVSINQDGICPSLNGITTNSMSMSNGTTTSMYCADAIRFFDPGGPDADYPTGTSALTQVFVSEDNRPVAIHFDSLSLSKASYLRIFTGEQKVVDSLLYTFTYGSDVPEIIVSAGNTLTVQFVPGPLSASGWDAVVSPAPGMAIADVYPYNQVRYTDQLCQTTDPFTPSFDGWENLVSQELLNTLVQTPGTRTFTDTTTSVKGCDSVTIYTLVVNQPPVRSDTTVVITSVDGGYQWHGETYTETGQYTFAVSSTSSVTGCDSLDRLNLIVLQVDTSDNEICIGETTQLYVQVQTPNIVSSFDIPSLVGDVVCQRVVQSESGSYTQTEILRPDSFLLHANDEGLIPMGVVFFVDPADNAHGLAMALVDAYDTACKWSTDNTITNGHRLSSNSDAQPGNNALYASAFDMIGKTNTVNILESARSKGGEEKAPAAYYCHYYDHTTQSTGDVHLAYPDWYMPSTGELSLYFAERLTVNNTLHIIGQYLESSGSEYSATVPFDGIFCDTGYWTSTEFNSVWVGHLNQKGQLRSHKKNGDPSASNYSRVPKTVRAIFAY